MSGLKAIKTKIRSVEKTQTVTKAMEAVSAAKMRKAQVRAISGRSYARAAVTILSHIASSRDAASHPLMATRPVARAAYVVITSDKGLAGALNSAVLRAVERDIATLGLSPQNVDIIAVGRKAHDFFAARGFDVAAYHPNTAEVTTDTMATIVNEVSHRFALGVVDLVKIGYQNFISTFEQRPTIHTVYPLSLGELARVVEGITPAKGALSENGQGNTSTKSGGVTLASVGTFDIEPSPEEVLSVILPKLASIFVYHALLETQASEHSARMVSMKSASDKAGEMEYKLSLQFNKARQAAITREVSEITGGMEAMATQ